MPHTAPTPAKRGRPAAGERAIRRTRILDAAVTRFAADGFDGTSIEDIAATAGVTKRTVYVYVGDKAAIFSAAVEREHDRIRAVASDSATLPEVAAALVFVLLSDPAIVLHRLVIAEAPRFPQLARDFYTAGPQHSIDLLARLLPEADPAYAAHPQPDVHPDAADMGRGQALYTLLLGESHRRRLLALDRAPTRAQARARANWALRTLTMD
jgi:AcrR family transcriptional regulator